MDPNWANWWPLHEMWPLGALGSIRVKTTSTQEETSTIGRETAPTLAQLLLKWGPSIIVGIMIPFVGWLWHDREAVLARTVELQMQLTTHDGMFKSLVDYNVAQDKLREYEVKSLSERLDIQRKQIDVLQQQAIDHANKDERIYRKIEQR